MDKVARLFTSLDEADKADYQHLRSLTPEQRIQMLLEIIENYYGPFEGFERVCRITELERG